MRIVQLAPLYERVPPERYGGTERVETKAVSHGSVAERDRPSSCPPLS